MPPQALAQQAVVRAAQQIAPGIEVGGQGGPHGETGYETGYQGETAYEYGQSSDGGYGDSGYSRPYSGRWIRRGRRIILFGGIAMYFSYQVGQSYRAGDVEGARRASANARAWGIVGIVVGGIVLVSVLSSY